MRARILACAIAVCMSLVAVPAQAASPKIQLGAAQSNGSSMNLALTAKYKNKVVTIEYGVKSGKKFKFSKLASVRTNALGVGTYCTTKRLATGAKLQVKVGKLVVASTNVGTRARIPGCAIAAPTNLALASSSDSGVSSTDGITNANSLTYTGRAIAGSTVSIAIDGTTATTCLTNSGGNFTCTVSSQVPEGSRIVTATATLGSSVSPTVTAAALEIDRTGPTFGLTWNRDEIGAGANLILSLTPNEPIDGFTLNDISRPTDAAFSMITFGQPTQTQDGYQIAVAANNYNATSYDVWVFQDAFTDIAGNPNVGPSYSNDDSKWLTRSPALTLDIYGPEIASVTLTEINNLGFTYGKLAFTFNEGANGVTMDNFEVASSSRISCSQFNMYTGSRPLSNLSIDSLLHTDYAGTYWVYIDLPDFNSMRSFNFASQLHSLSIANYGITDEYGNSGIGTYFEIGDWATARQCP
jgi:hypothetical protein